MEDDDSGDIPKQPEQSTAFDYWDTFGSRANRFRIFSGKEGDGRDRQQQQKKRERERERDAFPSAAECNGERESPKLIMHNKPVGTKNGRIDRTREGARTDRNGTFASIARLSFRSVLSLTNSFG